MPPTRRPRAHHRAVIPAITAVSNTLAVQDGPRENSNKNCVIKRPEMIV